ncbi:type II-A CRISPR-associated protein Csn2 [Streptococcus massiliensis]|uniref:CRISPR type II-A/NMEMI-associated protein Csn2 n=1 Tax=Streptococcus massiliensis TaxID=313439 RepID=A0A380KYZ4_9STRE|nr:type II-A CRISPR-associated protein Csn2 [Streptococcus massiliensis]SUN76156.1 CRISPR type II-A/NMEMI-associated protein Csn2 [Streptococcus massiliensis]
MKLNFPLLDAPISLDKTTFLVLKDQVVFANIVKQVYQYSEESELKIFDKDYQSLKESEVMLVSDILGFEVNSSSVLKIIYSSLEEQLNEKTEIKSEIERLSSKITDLIAFECLENELDLAYDEITLLELVKALGVKIETQSDTIFEKCLEIIQVFKYLAKKKLLIFINSCSFFSKEEMSHIVEYIQLNNIHALFIEPREIYDFPQYIMDEDYFLMAKNMI